jgi:hypothetical protein
MMTRYVCYVQYMFTVCVCVSLHGTTEITRVLCNVRKSYVTKLYVTIFSFFLLSFVIGSELGVSPHNFISPLPSTV